MRWSSGFSGKNLGQKMEIKRICVYCGSNSGDLPEFKTEAEKLGKRLAKQNIELVYGGGNVGLMGHIADTVLDAGGIVNGVIPKSLMEKEVGHMGLTNLILVDSMHERKARMAELADGFIAMPGGFGTFEEIFEVLTWAQLGMHSKPCALFNAANYYEKLAEFLDLTVARKFVKEKNREMLIIEKDPDVLLQKMHSYDAPKVQKWIR